MKSKLKLAGFLIVILSINLFAQKFSADPKDLRNNATFVSEAPFEKIVGLSSGLDATVTINKEDITVLVQATEKLVGAEIEALIEQCLIHAYQENTDKLSVTHFLEEKAVLRPISVAFKDNFDAIIEWTTKHARAASAEPSALVAAKAAGVSKTRTIKIRKSVVPRNKLN